MCGNGIDVYFYFALVLHGAAAAVWLAGCCFGHYYVAARWIGTWRRCYLVFMLYSMCKIVKCPINLNIVFVYVYVCLNECLEFVCDSIVSIRNAYGLCLSGNSIKGVILCGTRTSNEDKKSAEIIEKCWEIERERIFLIVTIAQNQPVSIAFVWMCCYIFFIEK